MRPLHRRAITNLQRTYFSAILSNIYFSMNVNGTLLIQNDHCPLADGIHRI